MRGSSTYQEILAEGRAEGREEGRHQGELTALLRVGPRRLGAPDAVTNQILDTAPLERLENWLDQVSDVASWEELLRR